MKTATTRNADAPACITPSSQHHSQAGEDACATDPTES